jgi:hypothetical protein
MNGSSMTFDLRLIYEYCSLFPAWLKRQYLRRKIDRNRERPCALSLLTSRLLNGVALAHPGIDSDILIHHLIDALVFSGRGMISYLNPYLHGRLSELSVYYRVGSSQWRQTRIVMIFSAIWRDDPGELKILLQVEGGSLFTYWSNFYGSASHSVPGSGAVMKTLLLYGDWESAWMHSWLHATPSAALKFPI